MVNFINSNTVMKTLYLIRHAKSSWSDDSLNDFDRPLNARGLRDAPMMGVRLKEKKIKPDLLITSPALRAQSTCELIADAMAYPHSQISKTVSLYNADLDDILAAVKGLKDTKHTVMLFGHNPGLTEFANSVLNERLTNIPTCGVVACSFDIDSWENIEPGLGKLIFFDTPKQKR